jgi:hypothetical protein
MNSFSASIDMRDLRLLLHPKWDETPPGNGELALAVPRIDPDDGDLIGWRDVIPRGKFERGTRTGRNSAAYASRGIKLSYLPHILRS